MEDTCHADLISIRMAMESHTGEQIGSRGKEKVTFML